MATPSAPASVAVVDASVAVKWVLQEAETMEAQSLLADWLARGIQPIAPSWFACEVANVLYQQTRRGTVTVSDGRELLRRVLAVVALVDTPAADALRAYEIADRTAQPTPYDCQYLALAERAGCEYWTDDARFVRGVQLRFPHVRQLGT